MLNRCLAFLFLIGCSTHAPYSSQLERYNEQGVPVDAPRTLSILQGLTTETSTQLSIVLPKEEKVEAYLWDLGEKRKIPHQSRAEFAREPSSWGVLKLSYNQLQLGHRYRLDLVSVKGELLDSRELATLDLKARPVRFAVASCMNDSYKKEQGGMWQALLEQKPEMVFFIGDNIYADVGLPPRSVTPPPHMWKRYIETRRTLDFYKARRLIPVLATWDDHDYGHDGADRSYPYKAESTEMFRIFFAQEPDGSALIQGPGVASRFKAFGQRFYLLDVRSFRTPAEVPFSEQAHLGADQVSWLQKDLNSNPAPSFLMEGDQFFGGYHRFESYEGTHPRDFKRFLGEMKKIKAKVFFISGDRHLSELMEIEPKLLGYKTYEFTTSGVHAHNYPSEWQSRPNPRHLTGRDLVFNFAILETKIEDGNWRVKLKALGPEARLLYERDLTLGKVGQ